MLGETVVCFPLDTDPGWSTEGEWAFGVPLGGGSSCGDPTSGYTGSNVYGYNLAGDYPDGMPEYYLTTTALNCSGYENMMLSFRRWLGVEDASYDHAKVEVSNDGSNWTVVWEHTGDSFCDGAWIECEYDISSVADNQGTVYIRWTMGPTDGSVTYPGWNIDDICLSGEPMDDLTVTPAEGLLWSGYEGGPFLPPSGVYTLTNSGASALNWTASVTQSWLGVNPDSGTLNPGDSRIVQFPLINAIAETLAPGDYGDTIIFTNVSSGIAQSRDVTLEVTPIPGEIDVSDSIEPVYDLNMPFGVVLIGASRTETITIGNTDPTYGLIVTEISLGGAYSEDFDDGLAQDWDEDVDADWEVVNQEYRAYQPSPSGNDSMIATYSGEAFEDFSYEVKLRRGESDGSAQYMLFRATADFERYPATGSAYAFGHDEGSYFIYKQVSGVFTTLVGWTDSEYLNPVTEWNTLKVVAQGPNLYFYINENLVNSVIDGDLISGRIGLLGYTSTSYANSHFFDDVIVGEAEITSQRISPEQQWYNQNPSVGGTSDDSPQGWKPPEYPGKPEIGEELLPGQAAKLSSGNFRLENVPSLPFTIPPLGSIDVSVVFEPAKTGVFESVVVIKSNDEDEPEVEVQLSGEGKPDYLEVIPEEVLEFSGHPGGPFVPSEAQYHLVNSSADKTIAWSAAKTAPWLDIHPDSGVLAPDESALVTVSLNSAVDALPQGNYADTIVFTNVTTTVQCPRGVALTVFTAPKVWINPAEGGLSATVRQGKTATRILTIGNGGDAPLSFSLGSREIPAELSEAKSTVVQAKMSGDQMVLEYKFNEPVVSKRDGYDWIGIKGLEQYLRTGAPVVPVHPVKILIPYGKEVTACWASPIDERELPGRYVLAPAQKPYRLSYPGVVEATEPDQAVYGQSAPWPGTYHEEVTVQSKRGYQLLILNLFPLQYVPATGEISYAAKLRLKIDLADAPKANAALKPSDAAKAELLATVDNPSLLKCYAESAAPVEELDGASPRLRGGPYKYVIITSEALANAPGPWNFQALRDRKIAQGMTAGIVTTEAIYAGYDGTRPDGGTDNQTSIRNFLTDAYQGWGTEYVLLGGTNSIVPARMFWVDSLVGDVDTMPVDMYYGCVDPEQCTFDYDADGDYGEPTDGVGGGEVDLYAEICVGRAVVQNDAELANFIKKTLTYAATDDEYLPRVSMVGEYLGFGGVSDYAKDSLEQIRLGGDYDGYFTYGFENHPQPNFWGFNTVGCLPDNPTCCWPLYDKDYDWPEEDLICLMNEGIHIFNHLGHANFTYSMKLDTSDLSRLTNTDYFFIYSQSCQPGGFDTPDCFAEVITSMEHGAFAVVMNARYGYGTSYSTDGPSHRYARQFWDAALGEGILELGRANQDSKEENVSMINESCMRWIYYELNLLGDPEQQLRFGMLCDWLEFAPDAGVVAPDSFIDVNVVFNAEGLEAGDYFGEIFISSNDDRAPILSVPATMTVEPDVLAVVPEDGFKAAGIAGGPLAPQSKRYTLTNHGSETLEWAAAGSKPWLDVDADSGTLSPGDSATVKVFINAKSYSLVPDTYSGAVTFTNITDGVEHTRPVTLTVTPVDYFTELFDSQDNDLAGRTLSLVPDGSGSFYKARCRPASEFPTDPAGGTTLLMKDDDYKKVSLDGGAAVPFYGQSYDSFYIGSNGYITFETGDTEYFESLESHFRFKRISALFDDLRPNVGGTISWKQLADRVAVTFENVPEYGLAASSSFQTEMFFDGKLSITWLGMSARDGLAGLSKGGGLSSYFIESDLSEYGASDLNNDGGVNFEDFVAFARAFSTVSGGPGWDSACDLFPDGGDGVINFQDLRVLASDWLGGVE
ncbi:MAG: hypothetical protein JXN61_03175 [Sedimentisphaerales bacterium]|nr:hypothetical protein [Sedimentisphaerales bacterium]